jgi:hypothetical protein
MTEPKPSDIWILIPAYNEDGAIVQVLKGLDAYGYSVVVVDDGSQRPIQELIGSCRAHVCRHVVNLGQNEFERPAFISECIAFENYLGQTVQSVEGVRMQVGKMPNAE